MDKKNNLSIIFLEHQFVDLDIYDDNIDVFITLPDEFEIALTVATPKNLQFLMDKENKNFWDVPTPWILVKKLTKEVIQEAIYDYVYKEFKPYGYWLKVYHYASDFDIATFDELKAKDNKIFLLGDLEFTIKELRNKIKKLDNLEKSNKKELIENLNQLYETVELLEFNRNNNKINFCKIYQFHI